MRFEPMLSGATIRRFNQLSYDGILILDCKFNSIFFKIK